MANQVYANGREISCKAADGKSIAAFPDVCFTPPQTPATPPGVPIPYPNTGFASDTTEGSKNVKISGKEAMLKNKSYFKKSSGDEAGSAPKKGVITSKITGKVYFTSWSMDVKFEGENVVRHLDLTTHNHASDPGDTPPMTYMDKMKSGDAEPCGNMPEKMKEACAGGDPCESGCKAARKCALAPHKPRSCCKNEQAHHVIPVRCFLKPGERKKTGPLRGKGPWETWPGSEGYNPNEAPCICLEGHAKGQGTGSHKIAHDHFDAAEDAHMSPDGTAGSWSYAEACKAGADSIEKATKGKGDCSAKCIRAQLNAYHSSKKKMPHLKKSTRLRADSKGTNTPQNFNPSDCTHGFDTAF